MFCAKHCSKCGGSIAPDDLFCSSCGAPVKVVKPDVAPTGEKVKKQVVKRVPRFDFWVACVFLFSANLPGAALIMVGDSNYSSGVFILRILGYLGPLAYGYYVKTSIRRLHDIGYSGWFVFPSVLLTVTVPILYLICLICESNNPVIVVCANSVIWSAIIVHVGMIAWLGLTKGVKGPNKYGPPLDRQALDRQGDPEAVKWYRKNAEQGSVYAQYDLGMCYMEGKGTEKNPQEALKWLSKAAEQGHKQAIKYLRDAAEQGDKQAKDALRALGLDE